MKVSALILLLAAPLLAAKESCEAEALGLTPEASAITRLYYTGTCHFRNEDHALAVASWEALTREASTSPDDQSLQLNVLNNLGYMKFFGHGTAVDQPGAIAMWQSAVRQGHDEAEYHLCHAYADERLPSHDRDRALQHCRKARLMYRDRQDGDPEILRQIDRHLEQLAAAAGKG